MVRRWCAMLPGAIVLLAACDPSGVTLAVDLRTDLAPGPDFDEAVVEVEVGAVRREARWSAARGLDADGAARIAELADVPTGRASVLVRLSRRGREVAIRPILVGLSSSTVVTAVITRSCVGRSCPSAGDDPSLSACLGGVCVAPECTPETPDACGPAPECTSPSDCTAGASCTDARCAIGACLYVPDDARCGAGERCAPMGCESISEPDGGPPDAGPPPADAGPGPTDAGVDAGPPDGGASDAGSGAADGGAPASLGCANVFLGSALGPAVASGDTRTESDDWDTTCTSSGSGDVAFGWVAPSDGRFRFSICGTSFDSVLEVRSGCGGASLACGDDECGDAAEVDYDATAGEALLILVDGWIFDEEGPFDLSITEVTMP